MRVWIENETDVTEYYWLHEENKYGKVEDLSMIKVISINGDNLMSKEERDEFKQIASNKISELLLPMQQLNYKCNLICKRMVTDKKSKVQNYKKVWKNLKEEYDLSKFELGEEVLLEVKDYYNYCGIAQTDLENIGIAIDMVIKNPIRHALFISMRKGILSEKETYKLSNIAFNQKNRDITVDNAELSAFLCAQGDIIVRWGDGSAEAEIDLVFNSEFIEL